MGHHVTSADIPENGERLDSDSISMLRRFALLGVLVGLLISLSFLFGVFGEKTQALFSYSWLFGLMYFITIAMGGCFWVLLHNLSNSGWGTSLRRIMENLGFVFPFIFLFSLPLLLPSVQDSLYEWMTIHRELAEHAGGDAKAGLHHSHNPHDHLLYVKYWYMNLPFWHGRYVGYFVVLGLYIFLLRMLSVRQDTDPNPGVKRLFMARGLSATGILFFGVTLTFLAIDWVKGLDYTWFSTMWGVYVFAGSALNAMAVILITSIILRNKGYLKHVVTPEHDHLMGKLTFAFTVFWAYISFSQFFLIWYANITEETRYFLLRNTGHWHTLSLILVFGHFALPFVMLLRQDLKKNNKFMLFMGGYLLMMHFLDVYHMVIPERGPSVGLIHEHEPRLWYGSAVFMDLLAFVTIGSGFVFFYLRNIASVALYPHRDPRILESANVHN